MNRPDESNRLRQSFVAVLDILGVSQLMSKASANDLCGIANSIKAPFENVKSCMSRFLLGLHDVKWEESYLDILNATTTFHNFSDTIVIICRPNLSSRNDAKTAAMLFFVQVRLAVYELFMSGYPVRGCIDAGIIYQVGSVVVGYPYINALSIGESLDFSGVVITDNALKLDYDCETKLGSTASAASLALNVPTKQGEKEYHCLNWLMPSDKNSPNPDMSKLVDIKQFLYEKFSEHGKIINASVLRKITNTENTIRAFILHDKHRLQELPK